MELVEQDGRLRRAFVGGVAKRLPHVHQREADALGLLRPQPVVELLHAGLRPILAAEPDRPAPDQIADHDPVLVSLAHGDLVDTDDPRPGLADPFELRSHVLLVQFLDGAPVQVQFLGHVLDGTRPAAAADMPGKPLRVQRVVGKEVQVLASHLAGTRAADAPHLEFDVPPRVAAGKIPRAAPRPVVPAPMERPQSLQTVFLSAKPA